jgi:hypothetical protein
MKNKGTGKIYVAIFCILIVLVVAFGAFYSWYLATPADSVKTAISRNELEGDSYILCKSAAVTGFHWKVIESTNDDENSYCNIIDESSFEGFDFAKAFDGELSVIELDFDAGFWAADNVFAFYVTDVYEYYCEETKETSKLYVVSGWDILSPVKHSMPEHFFESKGHITAKDLKRSP